jgi:hypothetical protein
MSLLVTSERPKCNFLFRDALPAEFHCVLMQLVGIGRAVHAVPLG